MNAFVLSQVLILDSVHSGGSGSGLLLLAGPVVGTAIYAAIRRYYRNADKSDAFERETRIELKTAISGDEQQIDAIKGTRDRRVDGDNAHDHRRRVAELE